MALKLNKSKAFPNFNSLRKLGADEGIAHPSHIIERMADSINDFIGASSRIDEVKGLKASILKSIHR